MSKISEAPSPRKGRERQIGYKIAAICELPDGTTVTRWLSAAGCQEFLRDWAMAEITSEYGLPPEEWFARRAELRYREKVGALWKLVDKHPTERPMIVRAIEAVCKGVADPEAFSHVAKLSAVSRALKSEINLQF